MISEINNYHSVSERSVIQQNILVLSSSAVEAICCQTPFRFLMRKKEKTPYYFLSYQVTLKPDITTVPNSVIALQCN